MLRTKEPCSFIMEEKMEFDDGMEKMGRDVTKSIALRGCGDLVTFFIVHYIRLWDGHQ